MKILVVDDEQDVKTLFQQRFRKEIRNGELDFMFAFSGEEALKYLENNTQEAILILSDINMPGMNGYQVLDVLKNESSLKDSCIIAVTANAMPRDIERGKAAGFVDYITKPLDAAEFLKTIDLRLEGLQKENP